MTDRSSREFLTEQDILRALDSCGSDTSDNSSSWDNTDDDPSFEPTERDLKRKLSSSDNQNSDSEPPISPNVHSCDNSEQPAPKRKRGRPKRDISVTSQNQDSDSDSDWNEIEEGNDPGHKHNFMYQELPGPKHCPPPDSPPIYYFSLFFTVSLLDLFVVETNRYASQILESNLNISPHSSKVQFRPVTRNEIKGFLAVILNMGIIKKPTIKSYWSCSSSQSIPWFQNMFSRSRFQLLLRFFHIVDNTKLASPGQPNYDPCAKFQPLVDHANRLFRFHFTPHQYISVDESLVGTKNHTQILQYMPNKHHHRWGIKFWVICDSVVNYCLGFYCYKGASSEEAKKNVMKNGLGYHVVMNLLKMGNYLKKGYHVFIDNYFTSFELIKDLYANETFLTGTWRKNRKGIPKEFHKKFDVGERKYRRKNSFLSMAFREKKSQKAPVILISSDCTAEVTQRQKIYNGREKCIVRPKMAVDYSTFMGGIDTSDMMLYTYLDERRTIKYWKKVVFNILGRMVLNAYILYKMNCSTNKKPISRLDFTIAIIQHLEKEWLKEKDETGLQCGASSDASARGSGLTKLPDKKERNCCVCSKESTQQGGKRKKTRTACSKCGRGLHALCYPQHIC